MLGQQRPRCQDGETGRIRIRVRVSLGLRRDAEAVESTAAVAMHLLLRHRVSVPTAAGRVRCRRAASNPRVRVPSTQHG
eukprot:scaffold870_cov393-Prasinococcus_capsulatus_cf.AAC.39